MKPLFLLGILALCAPAALAIEARRLAPGEAIVVDGRLDEAAWDRADAMDRFWELSPRDHVEASVRTEARFAYDGRALYVGIRAWDPDLTQLRAPFARRDNVLADQDMVVVNVDPVGNRKFAHFFRVNPNGSIGDGLWNEDTGTEDFSPDIEFEVRTGRFPGGWTAEFRIPFSSLRYGDPPSPAWSVMIFRNYPRDTRYRIASSRLGKDSPCFLCLNEPLTGLADLPSARHLALTPNANVRHARARGDRHRGSETDWVPSLDLKWRPRADVVVDATLNPDFSQVELDEPVLSGNAQFALFLPEKRPFFLEGADILEAPLRAISTRSVTDPSWGLRGTHRAASFDGTVLVARDDGGGLVLLPGTYTTRFAPQDFRSTATFARGRWQLGGATVGAVLTDRTIDGGGYNRVAGPDFAWFPGPDHRLRAQVLGSWTTAHFDGGVLATGPVRRGHAVQADWQHRGARWDQFVNVEDVGRDFRADNGFLFQSGYRRLYSETSRKFRDAWGFAEVAPYVNLEYTIDPRGRRQYQQHNVGVRWELPRATTIWTEVRPNNLVAVREGGGLLKRDQVYVGIQSNPFPWFAKLFSEIAYGDRVDVANNRVGKGAFVTFQANLRPHPRAEVEYRIDDDHVDSLTPVEGSKRFINQRVQRLLAIWHFGPRDSVRTIWQSAVFKRAPSLWEAPVSAREETETVSVVYGHRRGIGTSVYVGATVGRLRDAGNGVDRRDVEVFVKASWKIDAR